MKAFITACFAVVAILAVACGAKGDAPAPSPSSPAAAGATVTATATPAEAPATPSLTGLRPTATIAPASAGLRLRIGEPVPLPAGLVLYAADGTWEGPTAAIRRSYRDRSGQVVTETLLESKFDQQPRGITSIAMSLDRRDLAVGLCHGFCYGDVSPVTVVQTRDGGITWAEVTTIEPTGWVQGANHDLILFQRSDGRQTHESFAVRSGTETAVAPTSLADGFNALDTADGLVLYGSRDGDVEFARLDGTPLATVKGAAAGQSSGFTAVAGHGDGIYLFTVHYEREWTGVLTVTALSDPDASLVYRFDKESGVDGFWPAAWLSPTQLLGRGSFQRSRVGAGDTEWTTGLPAVFDLTTGFVSPIAEFMKLGLGKAGGPVPFAVQIGSFARVTGTGPDDCVNLRAEPDAKSAVLACYPDRVLVRTGEATREVGGRTWREVTGPDLRRGWVAAEFLRDATQPGD